MSDELLQVLSRRGRVAWPTCRRYIQELADRAGVASGRPNYFAMETITTLQALGHVTVDFTDAIGFVGVAPRVLARLPVSGRPRAVLVGHRTSDTEQALAEACAALLGAKFTAINDDDECPFVPQRLAVEVTSEEDLATLARAVEARFDLDPAAWRVLQVASTIKNYRGALPWRIQKDPNWSRRDFDPQAACWVDSRCACDGLSEFTDSVTRRRHYRLRLGERVADVDDRRWGCYGALAVADRHVLFFTGDAVLVPRGARVPTPIEVGLVLCSGFAPRRLAITPVVGGPTAFLMYRDIPHPLARLAAGKIGQQLVPFSASSEASS
jgi:hypothetical protein